MEGMANMQWYYIVSLLTGIGGLLTLDWRYKLAFWHAPRRTATVILITVSIFSLWDVVGISLGIFFHGGSVYTLPLRIIPEFPIEEIVFLFLLSYTSLLLYRGLQR